MTGYSWYPLEMPLFDDELRWILNAEFNTPVAGPLPSRFPVDTGYINLVQTGGQYSVASGELVAGASAGNLTDLQWTSDLLTRADGLVIRMRHRSPDSAYGQGGVALASPFTGFQYGFYINGLTDLNLIAVGGTLVCDRTITNGQQFDCAWVLRANGADYFINTTGQWELVYFDSLSNANVYAGSAPWAGGLYTQLVKVWQEDSLLNHMVAQITSASPALDTQYPQALPDSVIRLQIAAPGVLAGSAGFKYRIQDANNYCQVFLDNTGALNIQKVVNGTPSALQAPIAGVIANAGVTTVTLRAMGSRHHLYTKPYVISTTASTISRGVVDDNAFEYAPGVEVFQTGGWTLNNLRVAASRHSNYAILDRYA